MSEHGTFVTDYIFCKTCASAAEKILIDRDKYLCSTFVPSRSDGGKLNIIAGKIGGLYIGEELDIFEFEIIPKLEQVLCHDIRIAVLAETGERIFNVKGRANGE